MVKELNFFFCALLNNQNKAMFDSKKNNNKKGQTTVFHNGFNIPKEKLKTANTIEMRNRLVTNFFIEFSMVFLEDL